ncbi:MAG: hypothetical protein ACT4OZ_08100 [Gemmatimonadota bacterium]
MARIVTVYNTQQGVLRRPRDMGHIRWLRISEALAALGHEVDIASGEWSLLASGPREMAPRLRRVPISRVRWDRYDAVKTLFHQGYETLGRRGGVGHPFLIAKLGSVVGPADMEGIYFYGRQRELLFQVQRQIHDNARYITLLSSPARQLWEETIGPHRGFLLVPGAADANLPQPGRDPYPPVPGIRCVFSGNLYDVQPEATRILSGKLNELGRFLGARSRVFVFGPGDTSLLDRRYVTHLGVVPYQDSWDHMTFATVGVVVSAGAFMHNNESTKIYHYLRAGLPTVVESGFPNDDVVRQSGLGYIAVNGDMEQMARLVVDAADHRWDRSAGVRYVLDNHTWDHRAKVYDRVLRHHFPA